MCSVQKDLFEVFQSLHCKISGTNTTTRDTFLTTSVYGCSCTASSLRWAAEIVRFKDLELKRSTAGDNCFFDG